MVIKSQPLSCETYMRKFIRRDYLKHVYRISCTEEELINLCQGSRDFTFTLVLSSTLHDLFTDLKASNPGRW
jgi:hypothetical protein